jgi:hypothetical protein
MITPFTFWKIFVIVNVPSTLSTNVPTSLTGIGGGAIFVDRHRTLGEILFKNSIYFYVLSILAFGLSLKFRRLLGEWVDRKFFREHYKQDKILRELIEDVKKTKGSPRYRVLWAEKLTPHYTRSVCTASTATLDG